MSQGEERKMLLEELDSAIERGRKILEGKNVGRGMLQLWVRLVRFKLKCIFGESINWDVLIPEIPEGLPPSEYAAILDRKIKQTSAFLSASRNALAASYGTAEGKVFFGHGQSPIWREFKDFISDRLKLPCDEFKREAVAGLMTFERISHMLSSASFAFLVMTAEDEHADGTLHARQNVIHEIGLFQGRLGPHRAIVLLEDGCSEFSNIVGLSQIRFPKFRTSAAFEEMRQVLEREGILEA